MRFNHFKKRLCIIVKSNEKLRDKSIICCGCLETNQLMIFASRFPFPFFFIRHYLHVGDEGTQRMIGGEVDPGSYAGEEISSSSFGDVPSRVDAIGVITWLRLIGEAQADVFWKRYPFLPNVWVLFPSSWPHLVAYTVEDRGGMNFMYWSKVHISEGLRLPLPPLVH